MKIQFAKKLFEESPHQFKVFNCFESILLTRNTWFDELRVDPRERSHYLRVDLPGTLVRLIATKRFEIGQEFAEQKWRVGECKRLRQRRLCSLVLQQPIDTEGKTFLGNCLVAVFASADPCTRGRLLTK